jgi:hypothetical protein
MAHGQFKVRPLSVCVPLFLFVFFAQFVRAAEIKIIRPNAPVLLHVFICRAFARARARHRCFFTSALMRASNEGVVIGVLGS